MVLYAGEATNEAWAPESVTIDSLQLQLDAGRREQRTPDRVDAAADVHGQALTEGLVAIRLHHRVLASRQVRLGRAS
jgi:hypothetical protein